MRAGLLATVIWGTAAFGFAADDCKPGAFHHPAFTALDHDSMVAAYRASFLASFHREPTWKQGAGVDDGENWIRYANHYGEYSDGECRAGWNRYRELQLACNGCPTDPKLGDQPALFLPQSEPPPVVTPPIDPPAPQPAPLPSVDLNAVLNALTIVQTTAAKCATQEQVAQLSASVDQFHAEARQTVKDALVFITKYAGPVIAAVFAGRAMK